MTIAVLLLAGAAIVAWTFFCTWLWTTDITVWVGNAPDD